MYKRLDKKNICRIEQSLPKYQHYYDYINYNKVDSLYCYAVPYGNKWLAWFTLHNSQPVCYFIELINNKIKKVIIKPVSFHNSLALNTLLYGVLVNHQFIIETIFYYKGEHVSMKNNINKLSIYNNLLRYGLNKKKHIKHQIGFSLPIFSKQSNNLYNMIIPYKTYGICFVQLNKYLIKKKYMFTDHRYFNVKADKINDIYYLYTKENKLFDIALVDTYETSCYLNRLFRKIKENNNLDLLEESDDEDVFENISDDKFLMKKDIIEMLCYFNKKCNKWVPIIEKQ